MWVIPAEWLDINKNMMLMNRDINKNMVMMNVANCAQVFPNLKSSSSCLSNTKFLAFKNHIQKCIKTTHGYLTFNSGSKMALMQQCLHGGKWPNFFSIRKAISVKENVGIVKEEREQTTRPNLVTIFYSIFNKMLKINGLIQMRMFSCL